MTGSKIKKASHGFTLLETLIAITIMVLAFTAILMVENNSINATTRAKQMNIVAMLAKNAMIDAEFEIENLSFEEVKKEESETFAKPYEAYRWKREIKEIEFPSINLTGGGDGGEDGGEGTSSGLQEQFAKLISKYLSEAIREITITISWKKGESEQSFSVSSYWVNLEHEFPLSL